MFIRRARTLNGRVGGAVVPLRRGRTRPSVRTEQNHQPTHTVVIQYPFILFLLIVISCHFNWFHSGGRALIRRPPMTTMMLRLLLLNPLFTHSSFARRVSPLLEVFSVCSSSLRRLLFWSRKTKVFLVEFLSSFKTPLFLPLLSVHLSDKRSLAPPCHRRNSDYSQNIPFNYGNDIILRAIIRVYWPCLDMKLLLPRESTGSPTSNTEHSTRSRVSSIGHRQQLK